MRNCFTTLALLASLFGALVQPAAALPPYASGVVLVAYKDGTPAISRANARAAAGVRSAVALSRLDRNAEKLLLRSGQSVEQAIKALRQNPHVRYAEPDYRVTRVATSNDTYFTNGSLWGMYGDRSTPANQFGSQAAEAWAEGHTGSSQVYVGIIDEGLQVTHPDLQANIWVNPYEIPGDGIDNDGNGRADDMHGWDFYTNDASVYDGADDHGTHVAGTIGGVGGNARGVAGVNWQVTMISGKFLGADGGYTSDAVAALDYFTDLKVRHGLNIVATNNSWGGGGYSQALLDAINRGGDRGILFVVAAGNSSSNNDAGNSYPANYQCTRNRSWDCVVSVASITSSGALSSFSSYGATTVDLGAPGSGIWSTVPSNSYASYSGTSMATPHVTGAVALCASVNPALKAQELRSLLLANTVPTASLAGKTLTGGRLDVGALAAACRPVAPAPLSGSVSGLAATALDSSSVTLSWTDGAANETYFAIERSPAGCAAFEPLDQVEANVTEYTASDLAADTEYCFRVRAGNDYPSTSPWSNTASVRTLSAPAPYSCAPTPYEWRSTAGGTTLPLSDDSSINLTLPFSWTFYGQTTDQLSVSSNGFLRLDGAQATDFINVPLPDTAEPNAVIAPFWDDLNPSVSGAAVRVATLGAEPNRRFVVSWENVPQFSASTNPFTFQVVLEEETGAVVMNYLDTLAGNSSYNNGRSATVGLEDWSGTDGTLVSYNQATLVSGSALRCSDEPPPPPPPAPTAPSALAASVVSASQIDLGWTDSADSEEGFVVERAVGTGGFSTLATLGANVTKFSSTGLSAGTTYRYRVRAFNAGGDSAWSNEVSATTLASNPPSAPANIKVARSTDRLRVTVTWSDRSSNETAFEIGRARRNSDGTYTAPSAPVASVGTNVTRYVDTPGAGTWRYYVRSRNAAGASAWVRSSEVTTR